MTDSATIASGPVRRRALTNLMPREHGAWVMLLAPLALGIAATGASRLGPTSLLAMASICLFFAQDGARKILAKRQGKPVITWTVCWGVAGILAGALVLAQTRQTSLLAVAAAGVVFAVITATSLRREQARRFDRSIAGELVAALALPLTGPAAVLANGGGALVALIVYIASAAMFVGSVLDVEMLLELMRARASDTASPRQIRQTCRQYNTALAVSIAIIWVTAPYGWAAFAAFAPALLRSLLDDRRTSQSVPTLKAIGLRETVLAIWAVLAISMALRHIL